MTTCPQCLESNTLKVLVDVTILMPESRERKITKSSIRKKEYEIISANWDKERYYCSNCGWYFNPKFDGSMPIIKEEWRFADDG